MSTSNILIDINKYEEMLIWNPRLYICMNYLKAKYDWLNDSVAYTHKHKTYLCIYQFKGRLQLIQLVIFNDKIDEKS